MVPSLWGPVAPTFQHTCTLTCSESHGTGTCCGVTDLPAPGASQMRNSREQGRTRPPPRSAQAHPPGSHPAALNKTQCKDKNYSEFQDSDSRAFNQEQGPAREGRWTLAQDAHLGSLPNQQATLARTLLAHTRVWGVGAAPSVVRGATLCCSLFSWEETEAPWC